MMKYRHKKTGAVIEIASVLTSPDWEAVPEKPAPKKGKKEKPDERDEELHRGQ